LAGLILRSLVNDFQNVFRFCICVLGLSRAGNDKCAYSDTAENRPTEQSFVHQYFP